MSKKPFKIFILVGIVSILSLVGSEGAEVGVTDTTIKIGGVMLITGPIAQYGTAAADGIIIYIKYINEMGGINGRKIDLIMEDDGYDPVRSLAAAKKLVERDKVFAIITTSGTPQTHQIVPYFGRENIPSFSGIIPQMPVADPPRTAFTFGMRYGHQMILATDYIMKDLGAKSPKMAIIYQNDEYGKEVKWGAMEACKHYGLQMVAEETYKRGAVDFTSQVLNLKRANPDYIYSATVMRETPIVFKEAKKLGWNPVFIGNSGYCNDTIIELTIQDTPEILKNMIQVHYIASIFEENQEVAEMKAAFKKIRPDIDVSKHLHFHTLGWINGMIFCEALKRAGRDITREGFIKAMESLSNFNTGGLAGIIDFGPNRHFADTSGRIFKADFVKKTWAPITNWRKPSFKPSMQ